MDVTNRFKGLDLIECLKNYKQFHDIVQEAVIKTIPKKKKCKKARWLAEKREAKGKGEKERYTCPKAVPKNSMEK